MKLKNKILILLTLISFYSESSVWAGIGYTFYDEKINENNSYSELKKENEELKNKLNEVEKNLKNY